MRVMIVVTHLLGTGHLVRAVTLAQAYRAAGHEVCVVSGGMPMPLLQLRGVRLVQLPPLRADGADFSRLLDADGALAMPDYHAARRAALSNALADCAPEILITELFPFGRRSLRAEFIALLDAAHRQDRGPLICASVRDILAPPTTSEKAGKTENLLLKCYDAVLVHSDASVTALDASWPVTAKMRPLLHYTGFVAKPPAPPHPAEIGKDEIIVSAGGGSVGRVLFETALAAARQDAARRWRMLVGGRDSALIAQLARTAPPNATIEPARPDFRQMLHHAAASVSMCGYNTALDVLQTSVPAVFVPYDEGGEVEQGLRADTLARLDGIETLPTAQMTAQTLLNAITETHAAPRRTPLKTGIDGASRTVDITLRLRDCKT